jgi:hypothetical protein
MYKLYELFGDYQYMETKQKDLSWVVYVAIMITIFSIAI